MREMYRAFGRLEMESRKPQIGLRPRFKVDEERIAEIIAAMSRSVEAGEAFLMPVKWVEELAEIHKRYVDLNVPNYEAGN